MAKVKKYQLVFEQDFDFDMIGISSHHNDYRVVWSINAELGMHFQRAQEEFISTGKKGVHRGMHTMFEYKDEDNQVDYYLIKNNANGQFLIPEKPSIDFFIFICEKDMVDVMELGRKLRDVSSILAIFHFEPEEIDSAVNLVFN